jgi:hypothetical protein
MPTYVYTARKVIEGALRAAGVLASGEAPKAHDLADALDALNQMIGAWSAERLAVYALTRISQVLAIGAGSVSIGDYQGLAPQTGDIAKDRPYSVESAFVRDAAGTDSPVVDITLAQYNGLSSKADQGRPDRLYLDPSWPVGTINLYPVPDAAYTLFLDVWGPLARVDNAADEIKFPPEYAEALKWGLAVRLCLEYGAPIPPYLAKLAEDSKRVVKRQNPTSTLAGFDFGGRVTGTYDINAG